MVNYRIKVIDIELSAPPTDIEGLDDYTTLKALVRLHGTPLGYVEAPVTNGRCTAKALRKAILEQYTWSIITHLLQDLLTTLPRFDGWRVDDLLNVRHAECYKKLPLVTVAVCTRDRTDELALCLDALKQLDYPDLDILIVDNAPSNDATERLVRTTYPNMRYVCEPRPGLDWARNRAIIEARGEIIAYTDDDVVVDPGWVRALANVFVENPEVMAVTGLVVPYQLETEAQILFEMYGGFGRGFERQWYRLNRTGSEKEQFHLGAGEFGTGANMAYRRSLFEQIGYFDPALDVGTVTNGGGDLEMFFRVLKEGHTLVYEPAAIVRHNHRREYTKLRTQIANNGVGLLSFWVRSALAYPDERRTIFRLTLWWLWRWNIHRLLISFLRPARFPRDLILAELKGFFVGLTRYQKARRTAAHIADSSGPVPPVMMGQKPVPPEETGRVQNSMAVRTVELNKLLPDLTDVSSYAQVRIFVTWYDYALGSIDIANHHQSISATRLREVIIDHFGLKLLQLGRDVPMETLWADIIAGLTQNYMPAEDQSKRTMPIKLPANVAVSVVVATFDRPDHLRRCLSSLVAQNTPRRVEIIVVDNNPASGLTPPVVAEFPAVVLVSESRKGLSYARNVGFTASTGDIAIVTDDDVVAPPDWLERLVAPFVRRDVMCVTGNVFPRELRTNSQRLFEEYGGLGRGFEPFEVNGDWFESILNKAVPTWELGATANAAFRTTCFSHPQIGLMDEALGPGMPSGVGEDTYIFYQILKAGYTIVYEPGAYIWHNHRSNMPALRRQIYNYSKGHVAYHLTTLLRDHDLRALLTLVNLPYWHTSQIIRYISRRLRRQKGGYPLSLTLLEIKGNLAGPWDLWRSRHRVKREGRSDPYIPVSQRHKQPKSSLVLEEDLEKPQVVGTVPQLHV